MSLIKNATFIVETLKKNGFEAFFAGGFVRDLLLNIASSDIDIATDATPDQIAKLFPRTLLVGAKFGVAIVILKNHHFEIATFREDLNYQDGRRPESVRFSHRQADAQRRDFTINGMFWCPIEHKIYDYVGGQIDIKNKLVKAIGDPLERFSEDRLRMLRAVRFAHRFQFALEKNTKEAIFELSSTLTPAVSVERIYQELSKMSAYDNFSHALTELFELNLLQTIFPDLQHCTLLEIQNKAQLIANHPKESKCLLKLTELFTHLSLEKIQAIATYLKVDKETHKILNYYWQAKSLFKASSKVTLHEWAHLYADKEFFIIMKTFAAQMPTLLQEPFIKEHQERFEELKEDIKRIQSKIPVVSAHHLKEYGITPGPNMGKLLKAAEQISINERLHDSKDVLQRLFNNLS